MARNFGHLFPELGEQNEEQYVKTKSPTERPTAKAAIDNAWDEL